MKVLAIETSCERASIALLCGDAILGRTLDGHANHSEKILGEIAALLAEGGTTAAALDAVAFGSGPGAFTGLRLACGLAQGMALATGVGIAAVCSLSALALQAAAPRIFVATDARMGEVYHRAYAREGDTVVPLSGLACSAPEAVTPPDGEWFAIGSGFAAYETALAGRLAPRWLAVDATAVPQAAEVARLAALEVAAGRLLAPEDAAPLYVRDKVALTTAERLARGGKA